MKQYKTGDMVENRGRNMYSEMRLTAMEVLPSAANDLGNLRREWAFVAALDLAFECKVPARDALEEVNSRLPPDTRLDEDTLRDMERGVVGSVFHMSRPRNAKIVEEQLRSRVTRWWSPGHRQSNILMEGNQMNTQVNGQVDSQVVLKRLETKFKNALMTDDVEAMQAVDTEMRGVLAEGKRAIEDAAVKHADVSARWDRKVKAALAMIEA